MKFNKIFSLLLTFSIIIGVSSLPTKAATTQPIDFKTSIVETSTASTIYLDTAASVSWVDIHYTVNGGAQQNVRMIHLQNFLTEIPNLKTNDVISYSFTYEINGCAYNTDTYSDVFNYTVVSTIAPPTTNPTTDFDQRIGKGPYTSYIQFSALTPVYWVDVHYSINGGPQQNVRMQGTSSYSVDIPTLYAGDTITYSFTYDLINDTIGAKDSKLFVFDKTTIN